MTGYELSNDAASASYESSGYILPTPLGVGIPWTPEKRNLYNEAQEKRQDKKKPPKPPSGGRRARMGKLAVEGNLS